MDKPHIKIEFGSAEALVREFEDNLSTGGALAQGARGVQKGQECEIELVHPTSNQTLRLAARVVWVADEPGTSEVGIAFQDFTREVRRDLSRFVKGSSSIPPSSERAPLNVHERLRGLSSSEQKKVARQGEIHERQVLERIYGKAVWELLLKNPRLTAPEVAHLARMAALPLPLIDLIMAHPSWVRNPQVRRSLLCNRRVGRETITKLLRTMPKGELRLVPKQTAYPTTVRQTAAQMLKR